MDFQKIDTGLDEDEDELFFEDPDPEPVVPAAVAVEPEKPARRRVAKGKAADAALEPEPAPDPAPAIDEPAPMPDLAAEAPPHAVGEPVVIVRGSRVPAIAMALAAIAALFASIGLLVALRNMAALETARHDVEQREAALARLPALLTEVEALAARQRTELERAAAQRPADIVTREDLVQQITALRFALSRMQAPGTAALAGVVRAGQTELADRIDALGDRVDSVEQQRAPRAAH